MVIPMPGPAGVPNYASTATRGGLRDTTRALPRSAGTGPPVPLPAEAGVGAASLHRAAGPGTQLHHHKGCRWLRVLASPASVTPLVQESAAPDRAVRLA